MLRLRLVLLLASLVFLPLRAAATWSLGIADVKTRSIAVAAASCTNSVYGIAGVVPGAGFVFAQAMSNMRAKARALEGIRAKLPVAQILKIITDPTFDSGYDGQQYAILSLDEPKAAATFTGNATNEARGVRIAEGISVQGNTLVSEAVLQATFDSLVQARWGSDDELARVAVAALAAGSAAGGDRRCGAATASSAFVTVVRASSGDNTPYLNVIVRGADARERNAVTVLQQRLAAELAAR